MALRTDQLPSDDPKGQEKYLEPRLFLKHRDQI